MNQQTNAYSSLNNGNVQPNISIHEYNPMMPNMWSHLNLNSTQQTPFSGIFSSEQVYLPSQTGHSDSINIPIPNQNKSQNSRLDAIQSFGQTRNQQINIYQPQIPIQPTQRIQSIQPIQPIQPIQSSQPSQPIQSSQPSQPIQPIQSSQNSQAQSYNNFNGYTSSRLHFSTERTFPSTLSSNARNSPFLQNTHSTYSQPQQESTIINNTTNTINTNTTNTTNNNFDFSPPRSHYYDPNITMRRRSSDNHK